MFGIVQGGIDTARRLRHAAEITALDFDGHALGGLAVGESIAETLPRARRGRARCRPSAALPDGRRHARPISSEASRAGIDMFDCVMPTRNARNGYLFTTEGTGQHPERRNRTDLGPIDPTCPCATCRTHSRAYLRHLYLAKEILYARLATLHNLTFYARHVRKLRDRILAEGVRA